MLIWLMLGISFLGGLSVLLKGDLKTSKNRHIVGRPARVIAIAMMALPFVVFGVTLFVAFLSRSFGSDGESALTHGMVAGVLVISSLALVLAFNLKRLSVSLQSSAPRPDLSNMSARSHEIDFSFLDRE